MADERPRGYSENYDSRGYRDGYSQYGYDDGLGYGDVSGYGDSRGYRDSYGYSDSYGYDEGRGYSSGYQRGYGDSRGYGDGRGYSGSQRASSSSSTRSSQRGSSGQRSSRSAASARPASRGDSSGRPSRATSSERGASRRSSHGTSTERSRNRGASSRDDRGYEYRGSRGQRAGQPRTSSQRGSSSSHRPRQVSAPSTTSVFGNGITSRPGFRFAVIAVVAIVLVVLVGFGISRCTGHHAQTAQQASSAASQSAVSAASAESASATSAPSADAPQAQSQASDQSAAATQASSSEGSSAQAAPVAVAAEPGDATYMVAQAAKLEYRNYDFAVDPSRTNWNFDKSNGHKTIYLTFDDGPSENTARILDILDKYGCKATFFVTGQDPDYFPLIKEAYRRGHTIGLHSMTHNYETVYSSVDSFWEEFNAIGQVVKEQIGYVPCFIRFPGGASNTISAEYSSGIMSVLVNDVQERGYQYYDWTLSCGDGAVLSTEETIAAGCDPTDEENATYLAHDTAAKDSTVEALPSIIEYYQSQGYSFEALDRNSLVSHHGVNN